MASIDSLTTIQKQKLLHSYRLGGIPRASLTRCTVAGLSRFIEVPREQAECGQARGQSAGELSRSKMVGAAVEATTLSAFGAEWFARHNERVRRLAST
jgi:hypothetical protein